ncbi:28S ribosomal protein S5, mitochondrial [Kappamyces sp. JEL0680]|nr:28S ribosomal protein S5, mitochondrial [Kappamyces sp. JEL0680]
MAAVAKATDQAKKNLKSYIRYLLLRLRTARPGTSGALILGYGVVTNNNIHEVMRCVGISDVYCKIQGSTNPINVVKATFAALDAQKDPSDIARMRGKKVVDVESTYFGLALQKRQ